MKAFLNTFWFVVLSPHSYLFVYLHLESKLLLFLNLNFFPSIGLPLWSLDFSNCFSVMTYCSALKYVETLKGKYLAQAKIAHLEPLHFLLKMYHRISVKNRLWNTSNHALNLCAHEIKTWTSPPPLGQIPGMRLSSLSGECWISPLPAWDGEIEPESSFKWFFFGR